MSFPNVPPTGSDPTAKPPPSPAGRPLLRGVGLVLLALIVVNVILLGALSFDVVKRVRPPNEVAKAAAPALTHASRPPPAKTAKTAKPVNSQAPPTPSALALGHLGEGEKRTIGIFRRAAPAVVFITTVAYQQDMYRRNVAAIPAGTGSGFVWDNLGHVVTNFHVIKGADAAKVTMDDRTSYDAKLVGYAIDKDIAVLRIEANAAQLTPLPRGSSSDLVVGQSALAIGNPFGLDHTLSTGVISGLEREIKSLAGRPIVGVIQTDAAINPGNSGGPLLNSDGQLIGMNTAIFSPSGASAGIGFAVPVDTIRRIVPQLIEHGKVTRPGLGIHFDPELQRRNHIKGVLVLGVSPGGAAEQAGIRPTIRDRQSGKLILGDIIVGLGTQKIVDQNDLFKALDKHGVGDSVKVTVKRGSERVVIDLKLTELPPLQ